MPAKKPEPTKVERKYLQELRRMERRNENFAHKLIGERLGISTSTSFETMTRLISKGLVDPHGMRLAVVPLPVVTSKGKRQLKAA